MMRTRHALHVVLASLAVAGVALTSAPAAIAQQDWPSRPVRIVVPYPPGALTDLLARAIGERLGTALKQPVVIENKPGAGTLRRRRVRREVGAGRLHAADGDLTTLGISPALYQPSPIDPVKDFAPVSQVGSVNFFLIANPAFPAKTVREMIDAIKRQPGQVQLRVGRQRQPASPVHGSAEDRVGLSIQHVPVQGHAGGDPGSPQRQRADDVRRRDGRGAEHPGGQGDGARHLGREADDAGARRAADRGDRARASTGRPGRASSRPRGRRRTSSRRLVRPNCRRSRRRRSSGSSCASSAWSPLRRTRRSSSPRSIAAEQPRWAKAIKDSGAKVD